MTAAPLDDEAPSAMAADAMQAAYFRECLADEREQVAANADAHRDELQRRLATGAVAGISRLRSQLRSLESELRYLDGLIARLDRRFSALWALHQSTLAQLG